MVRVLSVTEYRYTFELFFVIYALLSMHTPIEPEVSHI